VCPCEASKKRSSSCPAVGEQPHGRNPASLPCKSTIVSSLPLNPRQSITASIWVPWKNSSVFFRELVCVRAFKCSQGGLVFFSGDERWELPGVNVHA
jgi:hypothetical protein